MNLAEMTSSKVTTTHQAKLAYVYVRQSSLQQVLHHRESTDLQYRLVERAVHLGWPRERVQVIDDDLGQSGASVEHRLGFQRLTAEIGLGRVGLVVSLDASRLARNNKDWYQLLELCSLFGTLIADSESLYDPCLYTDRLLLGLSGMMSEAELHHLKLRLQAGARHKAERGALRLHLPAGLQRQADGQVTFHPDAEIQARIRLVFQKFKELGTARRVLRFLRQQGLPLPVRPLKGPTPQEVIWQPARTSALLYILKNPAYAGAYVYGQVMSDPARRRPGRRHSGKVRLPIDKWPVLLHNAYPAYISWEEFMTIQAQLRANRNLYGAGHVGAPRQGQALLQGIVLCGRCGARMRVVYTGDQGQLPAYTCAQARKLYGLPRCQEVRGPALDAAVEQALLAALAPDQIALALAALAQLEQEAATLQQHWQLRLERARYEAERARRQYTAVEPEHRLVARTLERQWEEKLRAVEQVEQEYQQWQQQQQLVLTPADRQEILALGENLPQLWRAPSTTHADRKQIVRLLIKEVLVDRERATGQVWFQINWQTGASSEHWYTRAVWRYGDQADVATLRQRLSELHAAHRPDEAIAATLNAEGFRTARRRRFSRGMVRLLRKAWQLPVEHPWDNPSLRWADGAYSIEGAAAALGVSTQTIHHWLKKGRLQGEQWGPHRPWRVFLSEEQIASLRSTRTGLRNAANMEVS